jgi:hypothetical protein
VPASDANGDTLRWRLATPLEADSVAPGLVQPGPPNATFASAINATTGVYTWNTIGATLAGDYAGATIGALSTGTLLVPYLGAAGTVLLTAACLVLGLLFLWASQRSSQ